MNIQPVSILKYKKPFFSSKPKHTEDVERVATVKDLQEMEARINAHNEEIIEQQTAMLGNVLYDMVKMAYSNDYYWYNAALNSAQIIKKFDNKATTK